MQSCIFHASGIRVKSAAGIVVVLQGPVPPPFTEYTAISLINTTCTGMEIGGEVTLTSFNRRIKVGYITFLAVDPFRTTCN